MSAPFSLCPIELRVNGQPRRALVPPHHSLLEVLRGSFHLTGVKEGCGSGECGACSVLVDGQVINACLYPALRAEAKEVLTIEGLAQDGRLHPLQEAFIAHGAVQCGYCSPGMILAAKALLDENSSPTREEVETALAGNFCRCTGYRMIVDAVLDAAHRIRD
ncbi:MAG: (2Fe-2S)-binding protein [Candidatus Tectomicrobia bacterium]|nr:(2Fe-2S)-binding protein [Candidatus Tectomicrobia bacterium]